MHYSTQASVAKAIGLQSKIRTRKGATIEGINTKPRVLTEHLEAIVGALYKVKKYSDTEKIVDSWLDLLIE